MSKSNDKKFDLDAAKQFAIQECAPTKKRDFLAKQAVWELYKELEKEHAAQIELEVEEDDAELENELASEVNETQSIFKEIANQVKALGVAGVMTIATGVYFQTQAVYENGQNIISEVKESRIEPTNATVSSSVELGQSISEAIQETAEAAATATESQIVEAASEDESNTQVDAQSELNTSTATVDTPIVETPTEPTNTATEAISENTALEESVLEDTPSEFIPPEPIIIDIPPPQWREIPSSVG